ncbi:hypothetical protein A3D72_04675 [Candidatus Uhrbacteria bacterium RIFCSPHIGHO2_02_FULL_57_19]|uniref:Uncharacterized protein n=1 Tax=Candidatus Uhrbacteria bacterium RIFCSPHIGHO2_02_FULL_57_19 TaxID=1802391 RepID=A0A1F7U278_9BACT|nr:MAG: hypothetical protein A3D72_04675 [Candidatus Uhrbacteria bacterium RIFCSPHIGHO2_02_FULL_57_19]
MDFARGRNLPITIGGALALLIIAAMYFFYPLQQQNNAVPETKPVSAATTTDTTVDVSAEVGGAVETPADKLPETNPFTGYKNPFE